MFPKLKPSNEFTPEDIDTLKKNRKFGEIEKLINSSLELDPTLCSSVILHTHDSEYDLSLKMLEKKREMKQQPSSVDMTYLLLGATITQNTD